MNTPEYIQKKIHIFFFSILFYFTEICSRVFVRYIAHTTMKRCYLDYDPNKIYQHQQWKLTCADSWRMFYTFNMRKKIAAWKGGWKNKTNIYMKKKIPFSYLIRVHRHYFNTMLETSYNSLSEIIWLGGTIPENNIAFFLVRNKKYFIF